MKKKQLLTLVALFSTSSIAFAAGMHGGGHDNHNMPMGAHWMAPPAEAAKANPVRLSSESVAMGADLYQQNCVSCHGENADGNGVAGVMLNPKPANLRAMSGTHPDGDFAYKIRAGRGAMPAWGNTFNEQQVWHLVNYIQTLNKQPVTNTQVNHDHSDEHGS